MPLHGSVLPYVSSTPSRKMQPRIPSIQASSRLATGTLRLRVVVFVDVRRYALAVSQPRARRALVRSRGLDFGLTIRV
jgi:hypothetical protein